MPGRMEFDIGFGRTRPRRDDDEPMRLLVLGDFSGSPVEERTPLATRRTRRVDIDNLDDVMRQMRPRLSLPAGEIPFDHIDDFHPDRLYARLDRFEALRRARTAPPAASDGDDTLGRLLGKPSAPVVSPAATMPGGLDALIKNIVAPHVVKDTSTQTRMQGRR